jgi:hypothetical protein
MNAFFTGCQACPDSAGVPHGNLHIAGGFFPDIVPTSTCCATERSA